MYAPAHIRTYVPAYTFTFQSNHSIDKPRHTFTGATLSQRQDAKLWSRM